MFSPVHDACTCPRCLELHSESGGWKTAAGRAPGPSAGRAEAAASFLFRLSCGPQLLDPMLLLLGERLHTRGVKTITGIQHRVGKGRG